MPRRSERDMFEEVFDSNPFGEMDPLEMYGEIQWDKDPEATWELEAPEPLVALGELAGLEYLEGEPELWKEHENPPYLAVGRDSNLLYAVPKDIEGGPIDVPEFDPDDSAWTLLGEVSQTDYYSDKGNEAGYYYHEHERPYPLLFEHENGCRVFVPQRYKGKRSYAVGKEGIIG